MKPLSLPAVALALSAAFGLACAAWAGSAFAFENRLLRIETDRYAVTWSNGVMTRLVTRLPREVDLCAAGAGMAVTDLPNGLGSFHEQLEAGRKQHFPVGGGRIPLEFPAQHPAHAGSDTSCREIANGMELTYRRLLNDGSGVLVQTLTVEPGTGDLVIRQRASSANPGVFGLAFSVLNLRPDTTYLVPFFGSQRWSRERGAGRISTLAWARFWSAALVIGEVPGGGTFCVWAQDPDMRPKYFHHYNRDDVQALGFEACEDAPYEEKVSARAFEWRFNTFAGNWMEPARRYKDWMIAGYGIRPRAERAPPWVNEIALFRPGGFSAEELEALARRIAPKHVVLHDWGIWQGFNRRLPEYIPQDPDYAAKTARAHRHGYHVGAYTSMLLVDIETHPTVMADYGLEVEYDALTRDKPALRRAARPEPGTATETAELPARGDDTDRSAAEVVDEMVKETPEEPALEEPTHWLVSVHPGSRAWREFYVDRMAVLHETYGVDLLYQDVAGGPIGSAGVIDGLTRPKAVPVIEAAIRERLPQAGLMGEYWTEVNACREDFGISNYLNWFSADFKRWLSLRRTVQPLLSYLFSDFCLRMAFSQPYRNVERFHREENINEVTGTVPYWNTTATDEGGEARVALARAALWAEGFRPWFPRDWDTNVVAYLRHPAHDTVRYVARQESTYCYRDSGDTTRLLYARLTGVDRVEPGMPCHIEPWIGYGPRGPIGLDPTRWYCLFPGEPEPQPLVVTSLPPGAVISGARLTGAFSLLQLDGTGRGRVTWRATRPARRLLTPDGPRPSGTTEATVTLPAELVFVYREPPPATEAGDEILRSRAADELEEPVVLPIAEWERNVVSHGWIAEPARVFTTQLKLVGDSRTSRGVRLAPPLGGTNVEHSIDGLVRIPDSPQAELRLVVGMTSTGPGDGVNFVVRVNGREIWRQYWTSHGGVPMGVSLGAYAGREVLLSLGADCGPSGFNTSCDAPFWGSVRIESGPRTADDPLRILEGTR